MTSEQNKQIWTKKSEPDIEKLQENIVLNSRV